MSRISDSTISRHMLQQVQLGRQRLFEVQSQVGSGKRLNRPADDPSGVSRLISMRTSQDRNGQYQRNIDVARSDLTVAESAMTALSSMMQRVIELSVQAVDGSVTPSDRLDIALEVARLLDEAIAVGNTNHGGRYIFAGHQTGAPPFTPDVVGAPTAVAYTGDIGALNREISQAERVATNITGDRAFPALFTNLIQFRDALTNNDGAALSVSVDQVQVSLDDLLELRSEIGAKTRRVEVAEQRLLDEEVMLGGLVAGVEEIDLAETVVQLQQREMSLQAALAATGRALNLSLLEFLR